MLIIAIFEFNLLSIEMFNLPNITRTAFKHFTTDHILLMY